MSLVWNELKVFCVVCTNPVPPERKNRRSITCSKECADIRDYALRARKEAKKCKYCGVPSSPELREDFKAWRRERRAAELARQKTAKAALVVK